MNISSAKLHLTPLQAQALIISLNCALDHAKRTGGASVSVQTELTGLDLNVIGGGVDSAPVFPPNECVRVFDIFGGTLS